MANQKKVSRTELNDPQAQREADTYENPVPSREFILEVIAEQGCPMSFKELMYTLDIDEEQTEGLSRRVNAMTRDGQLIRNRRGGYCPVNNKDMIVGRVIGHPDGFGFLKRDDANGDDLFLGPREMRRVWHGDHVVVQVSGIDRRGREEGQIIEVLERAFNKLVGRLQIDRGVAFLLPDNKRITQQVLIPPESLHGGKNGQMVEVAIDEHPTPWRQAIGSVIDVIGDQYAPGMETAVAIRSHDIPHDWPEELLEQIEGLSAEVPEKAKEGREDLRDVPLVTIDGADARDFDDAVFCAKTTKGWRLLVAIADVSAYVEKDSPLDKEAYLRSTSVYFPDRVVPMLPEVLSNGLCSINPKVDRLCMVCEMYFDPQGKMFRSRFFEGVMNSHARLTYDQVGAMLIDNDQALKEEFAHVLPHLEDLHGLYKVLHAARAVRGAIDFDTTETRFKFDENGKVAEVVPLVRHDAHRLIEECMLAANVAAARFLLKNKIPALYRVHERPSEEKLSDLGQFLRELGLSLKGGLEPTAKDYAELLEQVKTRADYHVIQTVLLRSMMQAVYTDENVGHFGLAFEAYAHFTSPIRRYPDLMVHRAIRHVLRNGSAKGFAYTDKDLAHMGEHCSLCERRADDASRDSADALKCYFMLDKVGESFQGTISGVNSFGLFVELDEIFITGLIHITALDRDYFIFDPIGHRLTGERSGKVYRLGDRIKVRVAAVNMEDRKIDFVLDDGNSEAPTKKKVEMIHGVPADQLRIDRPPRSQPGSKKPSKNPWGSRSESDEKKTSKKKASKGKKRKGRPGKKERAAAKTKKGTH